MRSVYLSSDNPRWSPTTEQHLRGAIENGLLDESHYLDLKRELEPGRSKNREHARDLASFAVDGGSLLVGIAEEPDGTLRLAPQPLSGLRERVESIARTIPDPPLTVVTQAIASDDDPGVGYLVIHVPASPVAPHMVDNRYIGRGDSSKQYLSDAEVLRLHQRRRSTEFDALELLNAEYERDPVPAARRHQSHLFLLAEPLAGRPEMLVPLVSGDNWNHRLGHFLDRACYTDETARAFGRDEGQFHPDVRLCTEGSRRTRGAAKATYNLDSGRALREADSRGSEDVVEVEVHEHGGVRMFMSRLSYSVGGPVGEPEQVIFDTAAVVFTRRLVALTLAVADEAGYFGPWALAAGATGLHGRAAYRHPSRWPHSESGQRFIEDRWAQATVTSYAELAQQPGTVSQRLIGQFLRALGVREDWDQALSNPPLAAEASDQND